MEFPLTALILELSFAGWRTIVSCWENGESPTVRICFGSVAEVEAFLDVVAPLEDPESMSQRARATWGTWRSPSPLDRASCVMDFWEYHLLVDVAGDQEGGAGVTAFGVLFPASDLQTVLKRLRRSDAQSGPSGSGRYPRFQPLEIQSGTSPGKSSATE